MSDDPLADENRSTEDLTAALLSLAQPPLEGPTTLNPAVRWRMREILDVLATREPPERFSPGHAQRALLTVRRWRRDSDALYEEAERRLEAIIDRTAPDFGEGNKPGRIARDALLADASYQQHGPWNPGG